MDEEEDMEAIKLEDTEDAVEKPPVWHPTKRKRDPWWGTRSRGGSWIVSLGELERFGFRVRGHPCVGKAARLTSVVLGVR